MPNNHTRPGLSRLLEREAPAELTGFGGWRDAGITCISGLVNGPYLVKHHNALLMANHGAVAYGADLWQAFDRLETLEHTARIAILARILGGSRNLPADAIEKLINVREAAGYLGESARCQACGYLHETRLSCPSGDRPGPADYHGRSATNGSGKISLSREELVELLSQAINRGEQ
jgi:L-fuculose-phosphate aldolase